VKAYIATTGVLFALLAALHVWRLVVEWPGIRAEFWIVAAGSLLSAILALWAGSVRGVVGIMSGIISENLIIAYYAARSNC
jgi:hypothetical protein